MTTEQQLIDAIAAAPDDELTRLIYADWLEEHGSPWADVWRNGGFCAAVGWSSYPWWRDLINDQSGCWLKSSEYPDYSGVDVLPDAVFDRQEGSIAKSIQLYESKEEAITAANRAFMLAWCDGWRPTQSDCRCGVRLVGTETPAYYEADFTPLLGNGD